MKKQSIPQHRIDSIITRANKLHGAHLTTLRGAVRRILSHHIPVVLGIDMLDRSPIGVGWYRLRSQDTTHTERRRDPEIKRVRADSKFRKIWLRRLRSEERVLLRPIPCGSMIEYIAAVAKHERRVSRLIEIATIRARGTTPKWMIGQQCGLVTVPPLTDSHTCIIPITVEAARRIGASIDMRGADATLQACRTPSHGVHSAGETEWKNGRPVSYTRATHDNFVRSVGIVVSETVVEVMLHETLVRVEVQNGHIWSIDPKVGLLLTHGPDSYHPEIADFLRRGNVAEKLCAKLAERAETRRRVAAERAAEAAEIAGVWVCVRDSERAGNCNAGTRSFCERHGLDARKHYRATEILAISNGDTGRARLAIHAAVIRDIREREAGVAMLSEHEMFSATVS